MELLVVIGIIAVLIGTLLPVLAQARKTAAETRSLSNLRQLLVGYSFYVQENKGSLPFGYPPAAVNGVTTAAYDPASKQMIDLDPVASRYPWRLLKYVGNLWPILHSHDDMPEMPGPGDDHATANSKAYLLSLGPTYGINSVFLGGDRERGEGFNGGTTPITGKSCAFRASEIRRPTDIIVFADCHQANAMASGFPRMVPPRIGAFAWWSVVNGKVKPAANTAYGIPTGWVTNRIVTGFFDGHAEARQPKDIEDMRNWCPKATTPDWDYTVN